MPGQTEQKEQDRSPPEDPLKSGHMTGRLVGVLVLAAGLGAFLATGTLAYIKLGGSEGSATGSARPAVQAHQTEEHCPGCGPQTRRKPPEKLPPGKRLVRPQEKEIEGSWQADFGNGRAFFQVSSGAFQLIYVPGGQSRARRYSRGVYDYTPDQGTMTLIPRRDFDPPAPVEGISYDIITMRRYGIEVFRDRKTGNLYWMQYDLRPGTMGQTHPLFIYAGRRDAHILWQRTE